MYIRHLVIGYFLLFLFSGVLVYISGAQAFVSLGWYLFAYLLFSYTLYFIWKKIRNLKTLNFFHFFIFFIYKVFLSLSIICAIVIGFSLYQNTINPAMLPYYTITNGDKTIRFQTMSHIASPDFYTDVYNNIFRAKKGGYVLFYEGVGPGSSESTAGFNKALGVVFTPGLYDKLSLLYGIKSQDNSLFLGVVNNKDYNIDLNLDEVMRIYKEKTSLNGETSEENGIFGSEVQNVEDIVSESIESLSPRELSVIRYFNQSLMNMIIKNKAIREAILKMIGKDDIFSVILDDRNLHLVKNIVESSEKKIFITYGMMHFEGVYELLKESDPTWRIISQKEYQVIRPQN